MFYLYYDSVSRNHCCESTLEVESLQRENYVYLKPPQAM